jgi:SAM-dependent methyltransferase
VACVPDVPSNFERYSAYYDLLYRDKDYDAEAEYVARTVRSFVPNARSILEFGSGTGRHGRLLAEKGFDVYGIERSPEMVAVAKAVVVPSTVGGAGTFTCEVGDLCTVKVGRIFDAVISLFHVISYQTSNDALQATFRVAAAHLAFRGLFLFDVWHGPAVLSERPTARVKDVADERHRVKRSARPHLDTNRSTVNVVYQIECTDLQSGETGEFCEEHLMRYLFPTEVGLLAQGSSLRCVGTEEFLTGKPPSTSTWGVTYMLQKQ